MGVAALRPHLFRTIPAAVATREVMGYLDFAHLIAAAVIVVYGRWTPVAASALLFVCVSWAVNRWPRYLRSPFSLAASFTTCLHFVLPLTILTLFGQNYQFGSGMAAVPRESAQYLQTAPLGILTLTGLFLAGVAGLSVTASRREPPAGRLLRRVVPDWPIGVLGLVVLIATSEGTDALIRIRLTGNETAESLWQFIFFDSPYLLLFPIVIAAKLMRPGATRRLLTEWQFALILLIFFLQATIGSTSKGFILTLVLMSFVLPLSYLQSSRDVLTLMPSRKMVTAAIVLSVGVFFVAQALRVAVYSGENRSVSGVWSALSGGEGEQVYTGVSTVAYRLSAALDRYLLIFDAEQTTGHSPAYAAMYITYMAKNFVNLVWPGTPYLEAYMPSSNLLAPVLYRDALLGEASKEMLLRSLNTQPFTIYGVALLIGGRFAPLIIFGSCVFLGIAYRLARSLPVRLSLLYLYVTAVHSYGFEVVLANTLHLFVSLFFFLWLMRAYRATRLMLRPAVAALRRVPPRAPDTIL
jgi:hypothetical protein